MEKQCSFEGCERRVFCKGYCTGHYQQHYRGQTLRPLERRWRKVVRTEEGKTCSKCDTFKLYEEFSHHKRNKDGRQAYCMECDGKRRRTAGQLANAN